MSGAGDGVMGDRPIRSGAREGAFAVATGYYGIPGATRGNFTVHVVQDGPICGWKPRREMEFQWCAWGVVLSYVECASCRRVVAPPRA